MDSLEYSEYTGPVKETKQKILIVFGSFVNGSPNPSDIDVLSKGMSPYDIVLCLCKEFGAERMGNVDGFDVHKISFQFGKIHIPIPCDSKKTNYRVLCYEPKPENPTIELLRIRDTLPAILRDETKTVEDVIAYLNNDNNFGPKGIPVNIEEFDGANAGHAYSYSSDYVNGRLSLVKAVDKFFGKENFYKVCDNIWWGALLKHIYQQKPPNKGLETLRKYSPRGADPHSAAFWIKNNPKSIRCTHGFDQRGQQAVDVFIETLYNNSLD